MTIADHIIEEPPIQIRPGRVLWEYTLRAFVSRVTSIWQNRQKRSTDLTRHYRLNDHMLKDIGLTRAEVNMAALESF